MAILDSGQRREFTTGAVRDRAVGKGRFDLLPMRALRELAMQYENGATKYGERNWEKGIPLSWYMDSAFRHYIKLMMGYTDEDHGRALAWNVMCFLETRERIREGLLPPELNDLPGFVV
jgi:hypothetical protein